MSVAAQIVFGILSIVVGVACLAVFIPLTAKAIWFGWDWADDVVFRNRTRGANEGVDEIAAWRRPAWRLGYWLYERHLDRQEYREFLRGN